MSSRRPIGAARRALVAVRRSDVLGSHPARALLVLASCITRSGGSLFTLADWAARREPDRIAVVDRHGPVTFAGLAERSRRRAEALARTESRSTRPRVALLGRNSVAYVEWVLACGRAGADLVLLNTVLPIEQLVTLRDGRRPDLVVCDREFEQVVRAAGFPVVAIDSEPSPVDAARPSPRRRGRRPGTVTLLTSGTTGPPKHVARPARPLAMARIALALVDRLGVTAGDETLLTVPLLHGHGLATLALSLAMGSPLHLAPTTRGVDLLDLVERRPIAILVVVPTILHRLVAEAATRSGTRPTRLKAIVCGSAPLGSALADRTVELFGPVLFNLYGTSETGLVTLAAPHDLLAAPTTVGHALPGVAVRIVDTAGREAPVGEPGRIVVTGALVSDRGERRASSAGGSDTGDLGHRDAAGRLFVRGRSDQLVVRGGEKFFLRTVEELVGREIPAIRECAVTVEPDDSELGSSLHLLAVLAPGRDDTPESLLAELTARLALVIRPTRVTVVAELPHTASGEIARRRLAAPG